MATGLTYPVKDRDDYPFAEFLWKCAKQFGPLVHMRDESSDAPIRLPQDEVDDFAHQEMRVKNAQKALDECLAKGPEDLEREADATYARALKYYKESFATRKKELRRFEGMLAQVSAWDPPTEEHQALKKFMIEQLTSSIDFDCRMPDAPLRLDAKGCHEREEEFLRRSLANAKEGLERAEKSRGFARNWILALVESVPPPPHMTPAGGLK